MVLFGWSMGGDRAAHDRAAPPGNRGLDPGAGAHGAGGRYELLADQTRIHRIRAGGPPGRGHDLPLGWPAHHGSGHTLILH
ncbi:hypothetical protein QJS66_04705 [Kocuria rhizophila]|nr:hypothetical protein QJS66_04705 [Kocuria rhizophila]